MEMDERLLNEVHEYASLRDAAGEDSQTYAYWADRAERASLKLMEQDSAPSEVLTMTRQRPAPSPETAARVNAQDRAKEWGRAAVAFAALGVGLLLLGAWLNLAAVLLYVVAGFALVIGGAAFYGSSWQHRRATDLAMQSAAPGQSALSVRDGGLGAQSISARNADSTPERSSGMTGVSFGEVRSISSAPRLP